MLHFQIDPSSGVPVYRQLMDQVKYYLASGALGPRDQLPSIRELAQSLAVNPTTVVKAYTELAHEDVVEMRQGKGVFIAPRTAAASPQERERVLRRLARHVTVEAFQLGASRGELQQVLGEEWDRLLAERRVDQDPVRLTVLKEG
jgi:GntR family transcriptional regulator